MIIAFYYLKVLKSGNIYVPLQLSTQNTYEILPTHRGNVHSFIYTSHHCLTNLSGPSESTYIKMSFVFQKDYMRIKSEKLHVCWIVFSLLLETMFYAVKCVMRHTQPRQFPAILPEVAILQIWNIIFIFHSRVLFVSYKIDHNFTVKP